MADLNVETNSVLEMLESLTVAPDDSDFRDWAEHFGPQIKQDDGTFKVPTDELTAEWINNHAANFFNVQILGNEPYPNLPRIYDIYPGGGYAKLMRVDLTNPALGLVAVKYLKQDQNNDVNRQCKRFIRELRVWKAMEHDHILPLHGLWISFSEHDAPLPAFVSPWKSGGSLSGFLQTEGKTSSVKIRMKLLLQVIDALSYMHNHRLCISHGDLHAKNILYEEEKIFLCDFGLSRRDDGFGGFSTGTGTNARWAAPERLFAEFSIPTSKSDMYEFGSTFWEVISGCTPYDHVHNYHTLARWRHEKKLKLSRPGKLHPDIWELVERCMAFEPEQRITSESALREMKDFVNKGVDVAPDFCG